MNNRIWKYEIPVEDSFVLELPQGAKILHIDEQKSAMFLWALIDSNIVETETQKFKWFGTGQPIDNVDSMSYIGSAVCNGGIFVWHLFEVMEWESQKISKEELFYLTSEEKAMIKCLREELVTCQNGKKEENNASSL